MSPRASVILWFSQRVGSTMLGAALENTGVCGKPREWFNGVDCSGLYERFGALDAPGFRDAWWREAATDNGVVGLKSGAGSLALLPAIRPLCPEGSDQQVWETLFRNPRHVFIERRNKVRQAVSWWRAIRSNEWHRIRDRGTMNCAGEVIREGLPVPASDEYDHAAIAHLLVEIAFREAALQELFTRWQIVPITVVYEDLVAAHQSTIRGLIRDLDLPDVSDPPIGPPPHERIADEVSEAWVQRFRRERQSAWDNPAW